MPDVNKAFAKLEEAEIAFKEAIEEFGKAVELDTVGLDDWQESIDDVLFEIDQELQDQE